MFDIQTLLPGQKITRPGVYRMSSEQYHSDCCDGPSISSSGLRQIINRSPKHYWAKSYLNPDREPEEDKEFFEFGRAAHTLLLGESGFRQKFAIRPEQWTDWRSGAAKQWRDDMRAAGRSVLVRDQIKAIHGIKNSLAENPAIQAGLLQGHVECSIVWKVGDIWVKTRPDVLPTTSGMAADIKTTTDARGDAIRNAVQEHGYNQQGALIGQGLKEVLGIDMTDFVLVWCEKAAPFDINISPIDGEWLAWGHRQNRKAIEIFARCWEAKKWPGYVQEITTGMPDWVRKSFQQQVKYGLLEE